MCAKQYLIKIVYYFAVVLLSFRAPICLSAYPIFLGKVAFREFHMNSSNLETQRIWRIARFCAVLEGSNVHGKDDQRICSPNMWGINFISFFQINLACCSVLFQKTLLRQTKLVVTGFHFSSVFQIFRETICSPFWTCFLQNPGYKWLFVDSINCQLAGWIRMFCIKLGYIARITQHDVGNYFILFMAKSVYWVFIVFVLVEKNDRIGQMPSFSVWLVSTVLIRSPS